MKTLIVSYYDSGYYGTMASLENGIIVPFKPKKGDSTVKYYECMDAIANAVMGWDCPIKNEKIRKFVECFTAVLVCDNGSIDYKTAEAIL